MIDLRRRIIFIENRNDWLHGQLEEYQEELNDMEKSNDEMHRFIEFIVPIFFQKSSYVYIEDFYDHLKKKFRSQK